MNKITMMAIAVTALCLANPIICFADIDAKEIYNYKATDIQAFEIDDYANTDFNDVIYMDKIISSESSNLIEKLNSNNIAIASAWTLDSMSDDNRNVLKGKVESGIPLIVSGDSRVLQDIGISVITNPNASYSAIYCDPTSNVIYCYGIESSDYDAERTTIAWVNSVKTSTALDSDTNYGDAIFYQETKICDGDRARINATALYSKLGTSNGFTYYSIQYNAEAVAKDNDWSIADMTVSCDVDAKNAFQHLIDYGPDNTGSEKTTSVSVNMSAGITGITFGTSIGWSYTVPSTIIHNQCDTSEDYFSIWHDIDEDSADSTVRVKPGMIVSTNSSIYSATDVYEVRFEGPYYDHLWPWDPTTELKTFTMECNALLNV